MLVSMFSLSPQQQDSSSFVCFNVAKLPRYYVMPGSLCKSADCPWKVPSTPFGNESPFVFLVRGIQVSLAATKQRLRRHSQGSSERRTGGGDGVLSIRGPPITTNASQKLGANSANEQIQDSIDFIRRGYALST